MRDFLTEVSLIPILTGIKAHSSQSIQDGPCDVENQYLSAKLIIFTVWEHHTEGWWTRPPT